MPLVRKNHIAEHLYRKFRKSIISLGSENGFGEHLAVMSHGKKDVTAAVRTRRGPWQG